MTHDRDIDHDSVRDNEHKDDRNYVKIACENDYNRAVVVDMNVLMTMIMTMTMIKIMTYLLNAS